ncbi:MAG: hypothetical protein PVF58_17440 [Candidatus Methanofastidiosia archaeon]
MDSLKQMLIPGLLLPGSAVGSLLFIAGIHLPVFFWAKKVLYFPFYVIMTFSPFLKQITGFTIVSIFVFALGVAVCSVYFIVLLDMLPQRIMYYLVGIVFFMMLLVVGRRVFVQIIYIPHITTMRTMLDAVKKGVEFAVLLLVVYLVVGEYCTMDKRRNLFNAVENYEIC